MTQDQQSFGRLRIALATDRDREIIYRHRHDIYARELGQHEQNPAGRLRDPLDAFNTYIVAAMDGEIAGFISITPPARRHPGEVQAAHYSIEKYLSLDELPFPIDDGLYEVRLLTVVQPHRGRGIAPLLMYAALRWIEAHGGRRIVAIGRLEVEDIYLKAGLQPLVRRVRSGAVTFELMTATVEALRLRADRQGRMLARLARSAEWDLDIPFRPPAPCVHGGGFFGAIGTEFDRLEKSPEVINADVLDAWFPPSPEVLEALQDYLAWIARTSPPTDCEGMAAAIARVRGVDPRCVLPGSGSSSLLYLAFRHWLTPRSRALILDPTYGEYAHILEHVIGCRVDRLVLPREGGFVLNLDHLVANLRGGYDLVALVNPNSPTGRYVPREELEDVLRHTPAGTRVWIDETYVEYAGEGRSLERFAAGSESVIVCKSMSKVYALSGLRAAYLCAPPHQLEGLRQIQPPWEVSLPAQVAAVKALLDPGYYQQRHLETRELRGELVEGLQGLEAMEILPSTTNFVFCQLRPGQAPASSIVAACEAEGLFLRDAGSMGTRLGPRALRIAVKDRATNRRMVEILGRALRDCAGREPSPWLATSSPDARVAPGVR